MYRNSKKFHHSHLNYFKRLAAEQTAALGEILGRYWHLLNLASVADDLVDGKNIVFTWMKKEKPTRLGGAKEPISLQETLRADLDSHSADVPKIVERNRFQLSLSSKNLFKASFGERTWIRAIIGPLGVELLPRC